MASTIQIEITEKEYVALQSIIAKARVERNEIADGNGEGYKSILLSYGILDKQDFTIERQADLVKRYERAYDELGEHDFLNVIKRVRYMDSAGKVKNVKMYAIQSLEQEISKKSA